MFWRGPKAEAEPESISLYATDDLVTRAANIVHQLGYRGAVGNFVLAAHEVLRLYEKLDAQAADGVDEQVREKAA